MPNWLLMITKTTGSFQSAARFIVSPNVPWLVAPSPIMQRITSSVAEVVVGQRDAGASGRLPPTMP